MLVQNTTQTHDNFMFNVIRFLYFKIYLYLQIPTQQYTSNQIGHNILKKYYTISYHTVLVQNRTNTYS